MRLGELTNLTWSDVDFTKAQIAVREPKNKRDRTIPMSTKVLEILKNRRAEWSKEALGQKADLRVF
jgi:integrase